MTTFRRRTETRDTVMEKFPQELIDNIIDRGHYADLKACSLVGRR